MIAGLFFLDIFAEDKTKLEESEIKEAEKIEFQTKAEKRLHLKQNFYMNRLGKN